MKRSVLIRKTRLAMIPLVLVLIVLFVIRTVNSQRAACALGNKIERALIAPKESANKADAPKTDHADSSEHSAVLKDIKSLPSTDVEASAASNATSAIPPKIDVQTANGETSAYRPGRMPDSQDSAPQIQDLGSLPAPNVIFNQLETELLVKFKTGVSEDQIEKIVAGNHTKIVGLLAQIGVYRLSIVDNTAAQTVVDSYNKLVEVDYAELDGACSTPEPPDSFQPLE